MSFFLQGRRPVLSYLKKGDFETLESIYLSPRARAEVEPLLAEQGLLNRLRLLEAGAFQKRFPEGRGMAIELSHRPTGKRSLSQAMAPGQGLVIITDRLQDVQNLGAITRTAEALGARSLIVTGSGARMTETVYRVSAGAAFFLDHYFHGSLNSILQSLRENSYAIFLADEEGDPDFFAKKGALPPVEQRALVIGSEYSGIKDSAVQPGDHRIAIRLRGQTESLNASVAAGILIDRLLSD